MKISRRFTHKGKSPYKDIEFTFRNSELRDPDGKLVHQFKDVIVPKSWSQVAVDILTQKYFRKTGVPQIEKNLEEMGGPTTDESGKHVLGGEADSRQVFHRLAGCWREWGEKYGYFSDTESSQAFYDETVYMLANQMAAPNSPQWFNTGLQFAYGIEGRSQGHYYFDPEANKLQKSKDAYSRAQAHACFIQSINDDLVNEGGLMDLWIREARLFKYGSGTGTNFSRIRGEGESLSGGGVSSGLMSFLKIGDRAAGSIKSGGTTRRAAKMVTLDIDHPDIEEFISWKQVEEQKVLSLVTGSKINERYLKAIIHSCAGADKNPELADPKKNRKLAELIRQAKADFVPETYIFRIVQYARLGFKSLSFETYDLDWQSKAYSTVSGQNSNNSVRVSNDFMNAVEDGGDWQLLYRTNKDVAKTISAADLWDNISLAAWECADPGLQFDTTINEWHTCSNDGRINASNPCSEYMFLDDTACNLASINLLKFYDAKTGKFKIDDFQHACRLWTIILEISVLMAHFPSKAIAENSYLYRTLGLGFANLGALLMVQGLPYDSDEGRAFASTVMSLMSGTAYATSAELSEKLGPFTRYEHNKEEMLRVIRNHRRVINSESDESYEGLTIKPVQLKEETCPDELLQAAKKSWDLALERGRVHGFRNAQVTAIAPTGTIGLLMDCDTTGIEPDFNLVKFKKLAGGGYFKIINQSIPPALEKLGYEAHEVSEIINYCRGSATLHDAPYINHESLLEKGFTDDSLTLLEKAVPGAFELNFIFNRWVLGDEFLTKELGLSAKELDDWNFNLLKHLGFTEDQIEKANEHVSGTMTIEDAPYLKKEHYPIFDCANRCGKNGTRFIDYMGHIKMMAAVQPFVSGAISKTINMPNDSTVDDVKKAYYQSWRMMLKSNALYRDGSKLSQPLSASSDSLSKFISEIDDNNTLTKDTIQDRIRKTAAQMLKNSSEINRKQLPSIRRGYTRKAYVGGHKIYLHTGEYSDGELGEIFLDMAKVGATFHGLMDCFAIAVSLGLQYGVPLEKFVDAFVMTRFEPNGPVSGHDNIKRSTSIVDFIFRDLAMNYLDRYDLVNISPEDLRGDAIAQGKISSEAEADEIISNFNLDDSDIDSIENIGNNGNKEISGTRGDADSVSNGENSEIANHDKDQKTQAAMQVKIAKMKGYEGDPCPRCKAFTLVRNGSCLKCDSCGSTTGCS